MLLRRCRVAAMSVGNLVPSSRSATSCLMLAAKVGAPAQYSAVVARDTQIYLGLCWAALSMLALVEA